jgi:hypothetical protein
VCDGDRCGCEACTRAWIDSGLDRLIATTRGTVGRIWAVISDRVGLRAYCSNRLTKLFFVRRSALPACPAVTRNQQWVLPEARSEAGGNPTHKRYTKGAN